MTIHLGSGNNPSKLYAGSQEVQKVYHGSTEVWSNVVAPTSGDVTISVTERSFQQVFPEAIVFQADLSATGWSYTVPSAPEYYDERLTYDYVWDFGDNYTFTAPEKNSTLGFNESGTAIGAKAAHTYRAAGTYTVSVVVYERNNGVLTGNSATGSFNVTVGNADTLFAGTNTIFMSPSGNFANAPAGAQLVTSGDLTATYGSYVRGQSSTPKRIMLNRGENYSFSGANLGFNYGNDYPTIHVVAGPGGGAKPQVNSTGGWRLGDNTSGVSNNRDVVLQFIDWIGPWNSVTGTGSLISHFSSINPQDTAQLIMWDGCRVTGFDFNTYITGNENKPGLVSINDCTWTNFGHSMVYMFGIDVLSVTGSHIGSDPNAKINSGAPGFNGGFPWRTDTITTIISKCDIFSRQGWSGAGDYIAYQGCLRLNANGRLGSDHYVTESVFEGGFGVISIGAVNPDPPQAVAAILFDSNYILGCWQSGGLISSNIGGSTYRNNTAVWPNSPEVIFEHTGDFVGQSNQSTPTAIGSAENLAAPIRVYNNTIVNLRPYPMGSVFADGNAGGTFSNVSVANNIVHQPNLGTPDISDAPLRDSGTVQFTPREIGYKDQAGNMSPNAPNQVSPADSAQSFVPNTGSAAINDANSGPTAKLDMRGVVRGANPDRGAHEV